MLQRRSDDLTSQTNCQESDGCRRYRRQPDLALFCGTVTNCGSITNSCVEGEQVVMVEGAGALKSLLPRGFQD
jgi:hypothetical protein